MDLKEEFGFWSRKDDRLTKKRRMKPVKRKSKKVKKGFKRTPHRQ